MYIFTCRDRFEDMMTCIYDAWNYALKVGHDNIGLMKEPVYQQSLFEEYIHVEADTDKVTKVVRSIKRSISVDAYVDIFYAALSIEEDALQAVYNYLRIGFAVGEKVTYMYGNPHVMRVKELRRRVGNESHHFREFLRFNSIDNKLYVAHIEPRSNIIWQVGNHFSDRMPSLHWMIIDDIRRMAVVHPKDEESYIRYLTDEEFERLKETEYYKDGYVDLWKSFFKAISIKERENIRCQRNLFPIWMRSHAVEFMD